MKEIEQSTKLKEEIRKLINAFLQEEGGNKITNFNIRGLYGAIVSIIDNKYHPQQQQSGETESGADNSKG